MKIEGYFSGIKAANEAVGALKKVGIKDAVADLNDHYTGVDNPGRNTPTTASSSNSLSSYVLRSDDTSGNQNLGPLAAASPMVSGMGGVEEIADVNYKVIVNAEGTNQEKAKQIISKMGGDLKDPNFKMPRGLENVALDDLMSIMINDTTKSID